jgi:(p)ppGpp synthase/HD superfamily hydrolase
MAPTIKDVRNFAVAKHGDQKRKYDNAPYIQHLDNVAAILTEFGYTDPFTIAAALLHDTVEDTQTIIQEINDTFGEQVGQLVYWLTDAEKGDRKTRTLQSAWRLSRAPLNAKLIKLADIIDNGTSIMQHDQEFAPVFLEEKHVILQGMDEGENGRLKKLPIFQRAAIITESAGL